MGLPTYRRALREGSVSSQAVREKRTKGTKEHDATLRVMSPFHCCVGCYLHWSSLYLMTRLLVTEEEFRGREEVEAGRRRRSRGDRIHRAGDVGEVIYPRR